MTSLSLSSRFSNEISDDTICTSFDSESVTLLTMLDGMRTIIGSHGRYAYIVHERSEFLQLLVKIDNTHCTYVNTD